MSLVDNVKLTVFDGDNFGLWKIRMTALLTLKNLWRYVGAGSVVGCSFGSGSVGVGSGFGSGSAGVGSGSGSGSASVTSISFNLHFLLLICTF